MSALTDELRRLHDAATPAPWNVAYCEEDEDGDPSEAEILSNERSPHSRRIATVTRIDPKPDANLIAFLRNNAGIIIARLLASERLAYDVRVLADDDSPLVPLCVQVTLDQALEAYEAAYKEQG